MVFVTCKDRNCYDRRIAGVEFMKMERLIGLICFSIALGMLFMFFIQVEIIAILIITVLVVIGCHFCKK